MSYLQELERPEIGHRHLDVLRLLVGLKYRMIRPGQSRQCPLWKRDTRRHPPPRVQRQSTPETVLEPAAQGSVDPRQPHTNSDLEASELSRVRNNSDQREWEQAHTRVKPCPNGSTTDVVHRSDRMLLASGEPPCAEGIQPPAAVDRQCPDHQ